MIGLFGANFWAQGLCSWNQTFLEFFTIIPFPPAPASTCLWRRKTERRAQRGRICRPAAMRSWRRATWPWPSLGTVAWWTPPSRRTFLLMGSPRHRAAGTGASGRSSPWGSSSNRQRRRPHRSRERYGALGVHNMNKTWDDVGQPL